jgi:hypothetical protein
VGVVVAVVGSREYPELAGVRAWVGRLAQKHPDAILVSGGARGVDRAAESAGKQYGLAVLSFRPLEYETGDDKPFSIQAHAHGDRRRLHELASARRSNTPFFRSYASAAKRRNAWIVEDADHVVAFWDGSSRGTLDTIARAEKAGKLSLVVPNEAQTIALLTVLLDAKHTLAQEA